MATGRPFQVTAPDGVDIAAQEWGNPAGPEILFIHGLFQSQLSWRRQVASELGETFRMATYDLRGHGASGKPLDGDYYRESQRWADEMRAVIETAGLRKPVIVAWSYAGHVVCDYIMHYGEDRLAGINFVDAKTSHQGDLFGPGASEAGRMASDDLGDSIAATVAFVRACTVAPLPPDEFNVMLAFNMLTPLSARRAMLGRDFSPEAILQGMRVPMLVSHGAQDSVVRPAMGRYTAQVVPTARASFYEDVGHMPFWEATPRFNRELAEFVQMCNDSAPR